MPRNESIVASAVQREIQQKRPFHSLGAEALIGLLRTAGLAQREVNAIVAREGITQQQYNVLRILRGAGEDGIPTLAIRDRMLDPSPGVTRLLDRLERAGYARRQRAEPDRRQVMCYITPAGLEVLARLDQPVNAYDDAVVEMLSVAEKHELIRMLDAIRKR
ncbi:MAG: MarR family transcriptional regulator [Gemmatimonadota bacterium]|nr:MarR family transcriptional regulator [Gemmatimonadota bacterium]MDE3172363.1 MarR family transcriptional regulator [Gemmatimonadota bacterium]MDE3215569.1 MarR family transcriptional regulator [Gemmatimonadota bacterium]